MEKYTDTMVLKTKIKKRKNQDLEGKDVFVIADNRPWIIAASMMFHALVATPLMMIQVGLVITPYQPSEYFIPLIIVLLCISCVTQIMIMGYVIKTDGNGVCVYRVFSKFTIPIEKSNIETGFSFFWKWHSVYIYYMKSKVKITKGYSFNMRGDTEFLYHLMSHRKKVGKWRRIAREKAEEEEKKRVAQ